MRRVLVIGSGGAGKSTLAVRLGQQMGLPVHHLDALYWRAGWTPTPPAEWDAVVARLVAEPAWILDGNYGGTLGRRLKACDTVIFLDLPRHLCLARVLRRWLRHRGTHRPDMSPGCDEQITLPFLHWIWTYPARRRPGVLRQLDGARAHAQVVHLRSAREVERFLSTLPARSVAAHPRESSS